MSDITPEARKELRASQEVQETGAELVNISNVARTLMLVADSFDEADVVAYLGGQLQDHHERLYAAYERVFCFNGKVPKEAAE
jgi:hypothetical protein